jgi:17beta-estradiol 17-dehydrogenase / very-long-chain 3-oxoacyl-CoA reductase
MTFEVACATHDRKCSQAPSQHHVLILHMLFTESEYHVLIFLILFTESEHHVNTKIIEADFTDDSYEAYHTIEKQLYGLEIGVLINNVGMTYPYPQYFLELPDRGKIYSDIIKCNICSMTNMTQIILPQMVERKKGVVVNVSSLAAVIPSPLLTVYSASKVSSYFHNFYAGM